LQTNIDKSTHVDTKATDPEQLARKPKTEAASVLAKDLSD
jgi:hypothetical protein